MTPATVPKTDPLRDHAFTLETGETIVVNVSKLPTPPSADASAIHLVARMVDAATGNNILISGSPVRCEHTSTVLHSALAEGLDVAGHLAAEIEAQAQRVRGVASALSSLAGIAVSVATAPATDITTQPIPGPIPIGAQP